MHLKEDNSEEGLDPGSDLMTVARKVAEAEVLFLEGDPVSGKEPEERGIGANLGLYLEQCKCDAGRWSSRGWGSSGLVTEKEEKRRLRRSHRDRCCCVRKAGRESCGSQPRIGGDGGGGSKRSDANLRRSTHMTTDMRPKDFG
jgi:hypothetical protein